MIVIEPPSSGAAGNFAAGTKQELARFLKRACKAVGVCGEITVLLADDARLKALNRSFRGKNKPTDVLSFPAATNGAGAAGDIAVSVETATRQASEHGHTLPEEVRILLLHGVLHLAGFDHETDHGEMRLREQELRLKLRLPAGLIERAQPQSKNPAKTTLPKPAAAQKPAKKVGCAMTLLAALLVAFLLAALTVAAYADRVYSEMGKFLARDYQDNLDAWVELMEPRFGLSRDSIALSASILRQTSLAAIALILGGRRFSAGGNGWTSYAGALAELALIIILFDRMLPQVLFARTVGMWVKRIRLPLQLLFYMVLPVTLLLGLLLSIASLAEHTDKEQAEHPDEGVDALLEAGEEEGILEESDRALVRSVVEFGDMVVREVMTPRPEMFAVPDTMTLVEFTRQINQRGFSRVPVYGGSLDDVTGIAFAHDLLQISDTDASTRTVREMQRPAEVVPEPKRVNELLREMQSAKQHMRIVIDEYGAVAGLVTIEDLIEAIVGNIEDEHDQAATANIVREEDGSYIVPGSMDVGDLRDLLADEGDEDQEPLRLPTDLESTTVGGLVSELAGHIPMPGEVIESEGLRLVVMVATSRLVTRVRVSALPLPGPAEDQG